MKFNVFVMTALLILVCTGVYGGSAKKALSEDEALQMLCGTWINPEYSGGTHCAKNVYDPGGTWKAYSLHTSDQSYADGTFIIEKAWKDKRGDVWYKVFMTYSASAGSSGTSFYRLARISESGSVYECVQDASGYPPKFEPDNIRYTYLKYYRK